MPSAAPPLPARTIVSARENWSRCVDRRRHDARGFVLPLPLFSFAAAWAALFFLNR